MIENTKEGEEMKRIVSIFLTTIMLLTSLPMTAIAKNPVPPPGLGGIVTGSGDVNDPFFMHISDTKEVTVTKHSNVMVRWSSDHPEIVSALENASVNKVKDSATIMTAVTLGDAVITLWNRENNTEIKKFYVKVVPDLVSSISVTADQTSFAVASTMQLHAQLLPSNVTNKGVTWTSSDETTATVDSNGLVTGLKSGTVTITAASAQVPAITDTIDLTIREKQMLTVIFDANGGGNAPAPIEVQEGTEIGIKFPSQIPTGYQTSSHSYVFQGWYTERTAGNLVTASYVVNGNMTVYAHYTEGALVVMDPAVPALPDNPGTGSGYTPGEVYAHKNAEWASYDDRIAKITFDLQGVPIRRGSDVIIVVDHSGSMFFSLNAGPYPNRWIPAKAAVNDLTNKLLENNNEDNNRVSLVAFDDDSLKSVNFQTSIIPIANKLNEITNGSGTCYEVALNQASYYASARTPAEQSRPLYVVFISDGEPNAGHEGVAEATNLKAHGATIYSIGIQIGTQNIGAQNALKVISSNNSYVNVMELSDLAPILLNVGAQIKIAATLAVLHDSVSDKFDIISNPTYPLPAGASVVGQNITIPVGNILEMKQEYVFYVKIKDAYKDTANIYPTNTSARLDYLDVNQLQAFKDESC